jgi:hypothetical protein
VISDSPTKAVDYPALYYAADASSSGGQRRYKRLVRIELTALVVGAAIAALPTLPELGAVFGPITSAVPGLTAASFLLALGTRLANRQAAYDSDWFDGRAVAETVKSQAWLYMMRVTPYDVVEADRMFANALTAVLHARPRLRRALDHGRSHPTQISGQMRAARIASLESRLDLYSRERLTQQADWYRTQAIANEHAATNWFRGTLAAEIAAAGMAVIAIFVPDAFAGSIMGFFAAVAAAFTASAQLGRHDELSKSYALACQELLVISSLTEGTADEARLSALVRDGEAAISREHTMWVMKRSEPMHAVER